MKKILGVICQSSNLTYALFLGLLLVGLGSCSETSSAGANPATIEETQSIVEKETFLGQSKNGVLKFLDKSRIQVTSAISDGDMIGTNVLVKSSVGVL